MLFYAKGGGAFTWLMLGSIAFNYWMAIAVDRASATVEPRARTVLAAAIGRQPHRARRLQVRQLLRPQLYAVLLATLGTPGSCRATVLLPIGISFYTFHAISYVVDVYRGRRRRRRARCTRRCTCCSFRS